MNRDIEESLLHAYLDDELELDDRLRVSAALQADPLLRAREARLRDADLALRDALRPAMEGPMPDLRLPVAKSSPRRAWLAGLLGGIATQDMWTRPAFAAVLALIVGALLSATFFHGATDERDGAGFSASLPALHLQQALETQPSGATVGWRNPDGAHSGEVTPVRTYKTDHGQYCREFDEQYTDANATTASYGVACREPDGSWRVRMRLYR